MGRRASSVQVPSSSTSFLDFYSIDSNLDGSVLPLTTNNQEAMDDIPGQWNRLKKTIMEDGAI
jgi:hypothetical protein